MYSKAIDKTKYNLAIYFITAFELVFLYIITGAFEGNTYTPNRKSYTYTRVLPFKIWGLKTVSLFKVTLRSYKVNAVQLFVA